MNTDRFALQVEEAFRTFVLAHDFPCLGAKAAFNSDSQTIRVFEELGSAETTEALARALHDFTNATRHLGPHPNLLPPGEGTHRAVRRPPEKASPVAGSPLPRGEGRVRGSHDYSTFIAIFEGPRETTEIEFEDLFWKQLRLLHSHDANAAQWAPDVASDPADPHFSFSFGGQALYVIGMHGNSSRTARRFPWPAMIFNPHEQFERLRAGGKWKHMQETIRERDRQLQGSTNPMLSDFGEQSEARQYSGRAVEANWRAPFQAANPGKCPFAH